MNDNNKITILNFKGSLTSETASDFESHVKHLIEQSRKYFILNGEDMEFLSSEGLGALIFVQKIVKEHNGLFVLSKLNNEVFYLLKVLGLDEEILITDSVENGISEISKITRNKPDINTSEIKFNQENLSNRKENFNLNQERTLFTSKQEISVNEENNEEKNDTTEQVIGINSIKKENQSENPKTDIDETVGFFKTPIIIECSNCGSYTRVHRSGSYMCPSCHSEFTVDENGTAIF